jgi:hypothetical protein
MTSFDSEYLKLMEKFSRRNLNEDGEACGDSAGMMTSQSQPNLHLGVATTGRRKKRRIRPMRRNFTKNA